MPGDVYPKFRAGAVQAVPRFLDRDATIDKLDVLVQKAVVAGADLVVFGESFVPAFPMWNLIYAPMDQHAVDPTPNRPIFVKKPRQCLEELNEHGAHSQAESADAYQGLPQPGTPGSDASAQSPKRKSNRNCAT